MRKFEQFFNTIAKFRSDMRNSANAKSVKDLIGDSVNNNRTVTVNQVIRYLEYTGQRKRAKQLRAVYSILKSEIISMRVDLTNRTDAIDLEELVSSYRHLVMNNKLYRRAVSKVI